MDKLQNLDDVLKKVEEIKTSLSFSPELLRVFSDIFLLINDIIPLMAETNALLGETTKQIPTALENLNHVTKTTEIVTNQVLDKVDEMLGQMNDLKNKIASDSGKADQVQIIDQLQNDANEIILAFQFQDITTQKLEHIHRIFQAIYDKFIVQFKSFKRLKENTGIGGDIIRAIETELDLVHETLTKKYFDDRTGDIVHDDGSSQKDIDQFFKK